MLCLPIEHFKQSKKKKKLIDGGWQFDFLKKPQSSAYKHLNHSQNCLYSRDSIQNCCDQVEPPTFCALNCRYRPTHLYSERLAIIDEEKITQKNSHIYQICYMPLMLGNTLSASESGDGAIAPWIYLVNQDCLRNWKLCILFINFLKLKTLTSASQMLQF